MTAYFVSNSRELSDCIGCLIDKPPPMLPHHAMQPDRELLRLSALSGFAAVALGAMGAHGPIHDTLIAAGKLGDWETAVRYHLPHSIFLYVLALFIGAGGKQAAWAWRCLFFGMLLFSGSIYALSYFGWKWLGPVTPLGGLSLMVGWLLLATVKWKRTS
jgi:uncharacterized membrane protein YgdD (TMEM256/DUF423 family)